MSKRRIGFLLGASALAVLATDVGAANFGIPLHEMKAATIMEVQGPYNNGEGQDTGVNEQGDVIYLPAFDGNPAIMAEVHMTSDVPGGMEYWQCVGNIYEITEEGPKQLCSNALWSYNVGGERNCNRPALQAAPLVTNQTPRGVIALTYGTDVLEPENTNMFTSAIDISTCELVDLPNNAMDMVQLSNNDDDTGGTGQARILETNYAPGSETDVQEVYIGHSAFENDGNGNAWLYTSRYARDEVTGDLVVESNGGFIVHQNLNIARQSFVVINDLGIIAYGGPYGNARPPDDGAILAIADWKNQTTLNEYIFREADEQLDMYYNDVRIENGKYENQIVMKWNLSNGYGDNTNDKGASVVEAGTFTVTDEYEVLETNTLETLEMPFQTHAGMCAGLDGTLGEEDRHVAIITGSPTGAGQGHFKTIQFGTDIPLSSVRDEVIFEYSDAGYQSNIYGANPNNQGRNFINCRGNVANAGYGVENGFRPYVKSFWAVTMSGKKPEDLKNAQFLSLVPATGDFDQASDPDDPCVVDPESEACKNQQGGGQGSEAGNEQASGCACEAVGVRDDNTSGAALLVLGLGLAVAARRRREES